MGSSRHVRTALFAALVVGCGPGLADRDGSVGGTDAPGLDAPGLDAPGPDAPGPDAPLADAPLTTDAPRTDLVPVSHDRELRAVWVSTVFGLDFPSRTGLTAAAARTELQHVVDRAEAAGLNALVFQIRPESDALYASTLEPASRFLSGTQGTDPGFDALAILLELAHARGIEVHAWMNPYRALATAGATAAASHVSRTLSAHAITYNGAITMDPGAAPVRAHVVAVVRDVLTRYAVDGIHFDDYFYPYPDASGTPFPDDTSFAAYTAGGGTLSRGDWRRSNVNGLVREVMDAVLEVRPAARFGVSPFGIYRPGMPAGIAGLDAYATIYCDARAWMDAGSIDYVAPQLYWPTTQTAQAFGALATWWSSTADGRVHVFPGHAVYRLGSSAAWDIEELEDQIEVTRSLAGDGALGDLHFRFEHVDGDLLGAHALLARLYAAPAIPPAILRGVPAPVPPSVAATSTGLDVTHEEVASVRVYLVYRESGGSFVLDRVVAPSGETTSIAVPSGTYAVSAAGVGDAESLGARIVRP